jgi:hypothetical protein
MLLLALFSLVIVFAIPKMTASLGLSMCKQKLTRDPEALAEYRARQAQTAAAVPQLPSFDVASFMAGSSSKKPAAVEKERKGK